MYKRQLMELPRAAVSPVTTVKVPMSTMKWGRSPVMVMAKKVAKTAAVPWRAAVRDAPMRPMAWKLAVRPPRKLTTPNNRNQRNASGGRPLMSAKANNRARMAVGRKLTTTETMVLDRGLLPCMPILAKMAEDPKPKPDANDRTMAIKV